jgi:hypothetical protein
VETLEEEKSSMKSLLDEAAEDFIAKKEEVDELERIVDGLKV